PRRGPIPVKCVTIALPGMSPLSARHSAQGPGRAGLRAETTRRAPVPNVASVLCYRKERQVTVVDEGSIVVGKTADVAELGRLVVDVGDRTIGIFRVEGRLYAYDNVCAHQGGPVCQGKIMPKVCEDIDAHHKAHGMIYDRTEMHIVCPWHGTE